jgi:hypothetical protein
MPLALPANTRLGWKSLPGTSTLTYYDNQYSTAVKSFIRLAPDELPSGKVKFLRQLKVVSRTGETHDGLPIFVTHDVE